MKVTRTLYRGRPPRSKTLVKDLGVISWCEGYFGLRWNKYNSGTLIINYMVVRGISCFTTLSRAKLLLLYLFQYAWLSIILTFIVE